MQFASRKVHPAGKSPCLNCEDRQCGCHVVCERYNAFQQARRAELDAIKEAYQKEHAIESYVLNRKSKIKRERNVKHD